MALALLGCAAVALSCGSEVIWTPLAPSGTGGATSASGTGPGGDGLGGFTIGGASASSSGVGGSGATLDCDLYPAGGGAPDCATYCWLMPAFCNNGLDQYPLGYPDVCSLACPLIAPGEASDPTDNTLACRIHQACLAQADPAGHCTEAGPGGDGACGENCEGFCALALGACTGPHQQFGSPAECAAECAAFDFSDPYSTKVENWSGTENAFACRMFWLMRAVADPDECCVYTRLGAAVPDPCIDGK